LKTADYWTRVVLRSPLGLLLDLDGTLMPFRRRPEMAYPDVFLKDLLATTAQLPGVLAVVVSGRPRSDLERWFGETNGLWLVAEHGAFFRGDGGWVSTWSGPTGGLDDLQNVLDPLVTRTQGALLERKLSTLAVHHRDVRDVLKRRLLVEVGDAIEAWLQVNGEYQSISGSEVVEVRPAAVRKTIAVEMVRRARGSDTRILALGDDVTDEDMFAGLAPGDEGLLVTPRLERETRAKWTLAGPEEANRFLRWLRSARRGEPWSEPLVVPKRIVRTRSTAAARSEHDLLVISNRLPDLRPPLSPASERKRSVGGLVTALKPVLASRRGLWLGWSGRTTPKDTFGRVRVGKASGLASFDLPARTYDAYYNGFCNRSLWPLFHSLPGRVRFEDSEWEAYAAVNDHVAEVASTLVRSDSAIWVHDFHLLRVAAGLRHRGHRGPIGLFLHVPFPGVDMFGLIPWGRSLLESMLAFDVVGLQTDHDVRNFLQTVGAMSTASVDGDVVVDDGRRTFVRATPIGIIPGAFEPDPASDEPDETTALLRSLRGKRLIIGVDRLDYTKGIPERLEGFARFLKMSPEWRGKVSLVQVSVPSRTEVSEYQEQRRRIEAVVGRINGEFGEADWTPVRYVYRSYRRAELVRFYQAADVCLVTPLRDGMNLVAKEFVAAQPLHRPGVLVLSLFAGAARELTDALLTNPFYPEGMARDIDRALRMSDDERRARHARLLAAVHRTTATTWAEEFVGMLEASRIPTAPAGRRSSLTGAPSTVG
jgi:alpha,alpha-trehalose-phosphate synthase [UDP-forming]/trehalose-phosphatase